MNYPKDNQVEAVLLIDPVVRIKTLSEIYSKESILIAIEELMDMSSCSTNQNDIDLYNSVNQYLINKLRERT